MSSEDIQGRSGDPDGLHGPRRERSALTLVVAVLAVVIAGAVAVAVIVSVNRPPAEPGPVVPAGHVHGLGVNETDGALMVASHGGLFRIDPGGDDIERVGDSYRDMMGFAVIGPDDFVASGHPDVAGMVDGDPGLLGLLHSTDAGSTWQSMSLRGEADLHVLVPVGDGVLAWDATSSEVTFSEDLRSWESRSTVEEVTDVVVDPADVDRVVAVTAAGALLSTDGGRTWEQLDAPSRLVQVAWTSEIGLVGVDSRGVLWDSEPGDGGELRGGDEEENWSRIGRVPAEPQVLAGDGSVLLVAVTGSDGITEVHRSLDRGRGWSELFRDPDASEGPS